MPASARHFLIVVDDEHASCEMRHGPLHDGHVSSARRRDLTRPRSEKQQRVDNHRGDASSSVFRQPGVIAESAHLLAESERIIRIQRVWDPLPHGTFFAGAKML